MDCTFTQPVIGFPPAKGQRHWAGRKNGKNQSPQPPPPRACPACAAAEARCPPPSDDSGLTKKSRMSCNWDQATTTRPSSRCGRRNPPEIYRRDRKSTRLNSSHLGISYAVFCLKKK